MRRKSSASNLLSSFKTSSGASSASAIASGSQTPTTKDYDERSLHSETSHAPTISSSAGSGALPPLPVSQVSSVESLRELVRKRISTISYLKSVHNGQSHWMNTILLTRSDLERTFGPNTKKQRTYRFAILGMSLSNLFDIPSPQDFLRALLALLQEFDSVPEDTMKPKMRNLFRGSKLPKKSGAGDYGAYMDVDASYLVSPHIPFNLDYIQVSFAFFEVLIEVYKRFATMLGPSHFSSPNTIGPPVLGVTSPTPTPTAGPGASQSPQGSFTESSNYFGTTPDRTSPYPGSSAVGIAGIMPAISIGSSSNLAGGSSSALSHHHAGSPPPIWNPTYGDMLSKVDQKFMRIITIILKKLDDTARTRIREELATLSPLLQNLSPGSTSLGYDYDDR